MAANVSHPQGFWSAVRDVVRCNRKDGKRWQCSREVVPGQKYCERHVGRGRNRPKRSTEGCSATSDVAAASSLGGVSSVTMAAAVQDVYMHRCRPLSSDEADHGVRDADHTFLPCGFDRIARMKILYDRIRSNFPYFDSALDKGQMQLALMDNAGGSQCPQVVIDAIYNYMKTSYAQPGAGYNLSRRADETVKTAHEHMKTFANAHGFGEVVFGSSTSQLLMNLSNCFGSFLKKGDELVIHEANHEANVSPWVRMAAGRGAVVKWWRINYDTFESNLEDLAQLLSSRTRIVAVAHVSNLLGGILNLETLVKVVKSRSYESSVRVVADGAAFAPHRAVDVAKWGVDWYVFSNCKVYGPHIAVLYGSQDAFMDLHDETASWEFLSSDDVAGKLELGSVCQEACAGLVAFTHYLGVLSRIGEAFCVSLEGGKKGLQHFAAVNDGEGQRENGSFSLFDTRARLAKGNADSPTPEGSTKSVGAGAVDIQLFPDFLTQSMTPSSLRDWEFALQGTSFGREATGMVRACSTRLDRVVVEAAYDTIALLEQPLQEKLLVFLRSREDVVIVGPKSSSVELRVPTISFVHASKSSADIAGVLQNAGFAVRHGHMHYFRLMSGLVANKKLTVNSVNDGAVRISMVHYNTPIEVTRLIACLQAIL